MLYHSSAESLTSAKWSKLATPAMGSDANTTYNSQSSFVFTLQLEDGSSMFIYMGDRWNFDGPGSVSRYLEILRKGMQKRASLLHVSYISLLAC